MREAINLGQSKMMFNVQSGVTLGKYRFRSKGQLLSMSQLCVCACVCVCPKRSRARTNCRCGILSEGEEVSNDYDVKEVSLDVGEVKQRKEIIPSQLKARGSPRMDEWRS